VPVRRRDPLANPEPLIRRVYAYVAYRIGDGPDAEDVTSDVFERALRYRASYDPSKGDPASWLIGIARHRLWLGHPPTVPLEEAEEPTEPRDLAADSIERLTLQAALAELDDRDAELLALRYGADLKARQIGEALGMRTNAVEVALHRALGRLRAILDEPPRKETPRRAGTRIRHSNVHVSEEG
jgi:RNA polymerase sigma-70 factor (ECF subfamily)